MIVVTDHPSERGTVRELRLDRPPANALDPGLIAALEAAVREAPETGAAALVLCGRPGMLSGGLDVPHLLTLDREGMFATWKSFYAMMRALATSPIPVAAAITGHAPAGGAVLSILCDHRIMAEGEFKIGLNEVHVGIPLPPVILVALQRLVGFRQAERLVVSGALLHSEEARRIGLVDDLVEVEAVIPHAVAWCQGLLALPPVCLAEVRRRTRIDLHRAFDTAGDSEVEMVLGDWFGAETQGALRALVERLAKKKG